MVPPANPERTAAFMRQSGLSRDRLMPISDSLANLADWLMSLCIEAGATAFAEGDGEEGRLLDDASEMPQGGDSAGARDTPQDSGNEAPAPSQQGESGDAASEA